VSTDSSHQPPSQLRAAIQPAKHRPTQPHNNENGNAPGDCGLVDR
jgi:hypothetical protein